MQNSLKYYESIIIHPSSSDMMINVELNRHNVLMQAFGCEKMFAAYEEIYPPFCRVR